MNNVLDLVDQAVFLGERATGAKSLGQCIWVYNRAIDIDGLRRFHHHLQRGRLSRRIERSPLPFGRHRWVSAADSSDSEIVAMPRPREEFEAWLNEQANTPLDSEHGPGWHLAVLPFTDGGAGVSLVISHCLTDGVGLCEALADAACGRHDPVTWPAAMSRRWWRAVCEDARQTVCDTRSTGRAVVAAARLARRNRVRARSITPTTPPAVRAVRAASHERITIPTTTIFVDAEEWDARAYSLGGSSNTLLVGMAARLAQQVGRVAADGSVALTVPVNERAADDTRANAITNIDITVDPAPVTTDLREIRATIKQALIRHQEVPNERWALLPIVPLLPKRLVRRMVSMSVSSTASVVASNLGVVNLGATRPDGTEADYLAMKSVCPGISKPIMHRLGGILVLASGRADGRVFVSVLAYQPGGPNSNDDLRQHLSSALADFSLTATPGWPCMHRASGRAC